MRIIRGTRSQADRMGVASMQTTSVVFAQCATCESILVEQAAGMSPLAASASSDIDFKEVLASDVQLYVMDLQVHT